MAGLLDFLNTPTGMGLLSGVAGYAANARRGAPINSIGRGLAAGLQGYSQVNEDAIRKQQQAIDNDIRRQQQELLKFDYETRRKKMEAEQSEDMNASKLFNAMFTEAGYDPERGGFMQVSNEPQPIQSSPLPNPGESFGEKLISDVPANELSFTPPSSPKPANPFDDIYKELNWTPGRIKFFQTQLKASPESAMKDLRAAYVEADRANRSLRKEPGQKIGFEDAMILRAQGVDVPGFERYQPDIATRYLGQKNINRKAGAPSANASIGNVMVETGAEKAAAKEGTDIGTQTAQIENKYRAIDAIQNARKQLEKGIYAGYWGPKQMAVTKMTAGAIGDKQKVINTEKYISYIGNVVIPRLQEFGGNDSVEELRYLRGVMAGDIELEPEALGGILDSAEQSIQLGIERLQRTRDAYTSGRLPPLDAGPGRRKTPSTAPQPVPASGVRRYNPATGRIE